MNIYYFDVLKNQIKEHINLNLMNEPNYFICFIYTYTFSFFVLCKSLYAYC